MRVCMLVDTNFVEDRRVRKEAKSLLEAGYQVTVIALRNWLGMGSELPDEKVQMFDGVKLIYIDSKKSKSSFRILRFISNFFNIRLKVSYLFAKHAISEEADIYHSHDLDTLLEGFIAARVNCSKLIYDSHEFFTEIRIPGLNATLIYRPYWKLIERLLISHVDGVITVCASIADEFSKRYGIPRPIIVHNCAELRPFQKQDLIRERFNISPEKKIVLYLGSLFLGRGVEIIIDSAAYLGKDAALIIIGPVMGSGADKYNEQLQARIDSIRSSTEATVIMAPPIPPDKVYSYLMSADLGIVFYEDTCFNNNGLPNKLFDYMMAGLPIIASCMSEIRRVIQETNSGIALKNTDAKKLGTAISRALRDPEHLKRSRTNARMFAEKKYNWANESRKLLQLYRNVLCGNDIPVSQKPTSVDVNKQES